MTTLPTDYTTELRKTSGRIKLLGNIRELSHGEIFRHEHGFRSIKVSVEDILSIENAEQSLGGHSSTVGHREHSS